MGLFLMQKILNGMNKLNLTTKIGTLKLKNPIMLASGTCGYGSELEQYFDLNELGGFITKGIYYNPRKGNPSPRIYETPSGMLNSIGLQGVGAKIFKKEILPFWEKYNPVLGVNVAGEHKDEFIRVVDLLQKEKRIDFFEINLSCPNIKDGGRSPSWDSKQTYNILKSLKNITNKPIIAKLSPNVTYIEEIAESAENAGVDAISLTNTFIGMAIDTKTRKPQLGNILGGVSGPAIRPMSLALVYKTARKVKIPIIGIGGITSGNDILEFIIAGASAVQIGTATILDPQAPVKIINDLKKTMQKIGYSNIKDIINSILI